MPTLSIVIPAYNEAGFIANCLSAIGYQTTPPNEVIVVNNNSTDQTANIVKSFPFVKLISEPIQGMIPARNTGLNHATGDLIARIDADTIIPKDWVKNIHTLIDSRSHQILGLTGPGRFYSLGRNSYQPTYLSQTQVGYFTISRALLGHETLFGSNMILTQIAWEKIKSEVCLDESKIHEDVDLAIHLGKYGQIIYDPKLMVGISNRPFYEGSPKHWWRLKTWITTVTLHRPLFIGTNKLPNEPTTQ